MNAIQPIARTDDTVTLRTSDYEALLSAIEDAEDTATMLAAGAREDALGKAEARRDHLPVELVMRLLAGEQPVRIWREHRALSLETLAERIGLSPGDLTAIEAGREPESMVIYRSLGSALGVPVDDLIP